MLFQCTGVCVQSLMLALEPRASEAYLYYNLKILKVGGGGRGDFSKLYSASTCSLMVFAQTIFKCLLGVSVCICMCVCVVVGGGVLFTGIISYLGP